MINTLTDDYAVDFFAVHDDIIYGVLKRCCITNLNKDYDDFVQIGRLALLKAYETFPETVFTEEQFYQFTGFAYRKVYWVVIDYIRKETKQKNEAYSMPEETESLKEFSCIGFENDWIEDYSIEEFIKTLPFEEKCYIEERVVNGLSITAIAEKHQVSRKTVYSWRNKVRKRLNNSSDSSNVKEALR